jgi:ribonuclease BN (tRNA processing enzyme)
VALSVTVLGCSGSYPGPGQACSGYLVRADGVNVVLDLGPGALANLQRHIGLHEVDAVVLSHSHPDHWLDLSGLRTATKYALGREGLAVYGTAENRKLAESISHGGLNPTIDWHEIHDGDRALRGDPRGAGR